MGVDRAVRARTRPWMLSGPPRPPGAPAIWAPRLERLALATDAGVQPLDRREDGWFVAGAPLPWGTDYRVVLDGSQVPDPRSRWQPGGLDGPSRVWDPEAFAWSDGGW